MTTKSKHQRKHKEIKRHHEEQPSRWRATTYITLSDHKHPSGNKKYSKTTSRNGRRNSSLRKEKEQRRIRPLAPLRLFRPHPLAFFFHHQCLEKCIVGRQFILLGIYTEVSFLCCKGIPRLQNAKISVLSSRSFPRSTASPPNRSEISDVCQSASNGVSVS
jgi:hypothetical protein